MLPTVTSAWWDIRVSIEAAKKAVDKFGTGTNGVRMLAGTLTLHKELEETIANFKHAEAAVTYSSGYVTNLTVISSLMGRGDYVFSDKLNHASIVDGCLMSGAEFRRFRHNDMEHLEGLLKNAPADVAKMVVADAVFSMDGDIIDLPKIVALCKQYKAWLMIDEAHSVGVLGKTGTGIEEHFNMYGSIDIKMGTLSKTIPSVGGYVAANRDIITYLVMPAARISSLPRCRPRRLQQPTKPLKSFSTNHGASND